MTDLPLTGACGRGAAARAIDAPLGGHTDRHRPRCGRRTGTAAAG